MGRTASPSPAPGRARTRYRLFLDTSALFAAMLSPTGGARLLLKLSEAGAVTVVIGPRGLAEIDGVVARKALHMRSLVALLLDAASVEIARRPDAEASARANLLTPYPPDAAVLAEALDARIDYFVSLDRVHFVGNAALGDLPFPGGTPGECLAALREYLAG